MLTAYLIPSLVFITLAGTIVTKNIPQYQDPSASLSREIDSSEDQAGTQPSFDPKAVTAALPTGATVATYVTNSGIAHAIATVHLVPDKAEYTVVIYNLPETNGEFGARLVLGILIREDRIFTLQSSVPLYGNLIYISLKDARAVPFAVRDVTGDHRPEIIVTSGIGASIGAAIQVFSFDGTSLHRVGYGEGHFLRVHDNGRGRPATLTARSRYERHARSYIWNGRAFILPRRYRTATVEPFSSK